jgi:preprotein translocase subunit SecG
MEAVVLVIHLIVALGIIAVVLLQRSEGGGLGVGGSGGGMGNFASQRATADALTRLTTWLGTAFVITSLTLAILATHRSAEQSGSILDVKTPQAPAMNKDAPEKGAVEGGAAVEETAEMPAEDAAVAEDGAAADTTDETTEEKPGDKAAE